MKRTSFILLALTFTLSVILSASVSFAEEHYGEDVQDNAQTVTKDTSWFDYENPKKSYEISTEAQLMGLASLINEEQIDKWKPTRIENFEDVTFTLMKDIKLTNEWEPIGTGTASHFSGIFDGNGHTISGLDINTNSENSGFFGYLTGEVRNLKVEGKIKLKSDKCGGIAGHISEEAKVINCTSNVKISAGNKTGGIVGYNEKGTIEECTNLGKVSGTYKVGGVVGENWGGTVSKCHNIGEVSSFERGVETYGTGGVAGRSLSSSAKISESYNLGLIVSNTEATGGVAGYTNASGSTIKNCYNSGNIQIINKDENKNLIKSNAGGIVGTVGMKGVKITNCYNLGQIRNADISGGIIGKYLNDSELKESFIKNNYYVHDYYKSGIGECDNDGTDEVSKATNPVSTNGLMNMSSALGTAYMKDSSNLYGNNGYPVLRWQQPISDEERVYISNIPKELQIKLDKYLLKNSNKNIYGQSLMNFFNPGNFISNSLVTYIEGQEKAERENLKPLN